MRWIIVALLLTSCGPRWTHRGDTSVGKPCGYGAWHRTTDGKVVCDRWEAP